MINRLLLARARWYAGFRHERFYVHSMTSLGLFNTVTATLFNRVLVRMTDLETGRAVKYFWDSASNHPEEA